MRRGVAIVLALVFSFLLTLPVFAVSSDANLPACCRKAGKHHCELRNGIQSEHSTQSGSAIEAGGRCQSFPCATLAVHVDAFAASGRHAVFAGILLNPAGIAEAAAGYRTSHSRSRQKRGPPASLPV